MADRDALINALAGGYYSASDPRWLRPEDLRNKLAPDTGMPTLPPFDNRPSISSYDPQQARPAPKLQEELASYLSPTTGAYGLASLGTTAAMDAGVGKYDLETLGPLASAMFLGPRAPRTVAGSSLARRIDNLPHAQMRDVLPSDLPIERSPLRDSPQFGNGTEWWSVGPHSTTPGLEARRGLEARVHPKEKAVYIVGSELPEDVRGQGVGLAMYQRLIDQAHHEGMTVYSDATVSGDARRIYDALTQRGYKVQSRTENGLGPDQPHFPQFAVHPPEYASPEMAEIIKR